MELQIFKNEQFGEVRMVVIEEQPWLVGKDVAEALGYSNTKDALKKHVDDEDKQIIQRSQFATLENYIPKSALPVDFVRGDIPNRGLTVINESGLYSLILSSKLPQAKQFKRWVTSEVLPSIRKHGAYLTDQVAFNITHDKQALADLLLMAGNQLKEKEAIIHGLEAEKSRLTVENTIMQPKAEYFDELVDRNLLTGIRETAKELKIKQKEFVQFLLDKKYLYRDKKGKLQPFAGKYEDLFELKESRNEKTGWAGTQLLITPKGRETFRLLFI
ncbi:BRO family protein [Streptococcus suis]|uniref:BRO family protein n=2 Tax=Streptococcus suis TaxID=1307 RepID=UPI001EE79DF4|nr:BRO family protein [Streptococcus suis]MBS8100640.1 phage repressor protein/antirepressor Ant [Streptococcus suis]